MKVTIPASSSVQDYIVKYSSFTGNAGDFVESSFTTSSTSDDGIAYWTFRLQLPNGVSLLNIDRVYLKIVLQDRVSSSSDYSYLLDATNGILELAAGAILGTVRNSDIIGKGRIQFANGVISLEENNIFTGHINFQDLSDTPVNYEYFAEGDVYIKYHV